MADLNIETTYELDNLLGDTFPIQTDTGTIISGQNLTRGAVLGKITASGKLKAVDDAAVDGSQTPYAVLAVDTDASGGDKTAVIYLSGAFNVNALSFGGDDTAADHKDGMRNKCMYQISENG